MSIGEAPSIIGPRMFISLLFIDDLFPLIVLHIDIKQVSMMSLWDKLFDLYGIRALSGSSRCSPLVCLAEV